MQIKILIEFGQQGNVKLLSIFSDNICQLKIKEI